jgi:hypothetical protein
MPGYRCGSPSWFHPRVECLAPSDRNAVGGKAQAEEQPPAIRAPTPPRGASQEEQRQVLWMVFCEGKCVRADLVALTDAIELEVFAGSELRRVLRFLRDTGARNYATRLLTKLNGRGFRERRQSGRGFWLK